MGQSKDLLFFLNPEIKPIEGSKTPLDLLYSKLMARCPHFTWLESKKFSPHVSLGKVKTAEDLERVKREYGANWVPITFVIKEFQVMSKLMHDTVVRFTIPLGKSRDIQIPHFAPFPFPENGFYSININWIPRGSTKQDLLAVFSAHGGVEADLVFKSLGSDPNYAKGWGHVIFQTRQQRDDALKRPWSLRGGNLEVFPCD